MHAYTSLVGFFTAAVMLATSASASSFDVAPSHLRFTRSTTTTVTPTSPGPGDSFNEGSECTMLWTVGTGSSWKKMTISLMTGSNEDMTVLTDVATDIDGTSLSSYTWTCPEVTPNSAIYFYQFTDKNSANPTWTTRFTIASASGASTTPTNSEVSDGETVEWGTGSLASTSSSSDSSASSSTATTTDSSDSTSSSSSSASSSSSSGSSSLSSSSSGASNVHIAQGVCIGMASLVIALVMV